MQAGGGDTVGRLGMARTLAFAAATAVGDAVGFGAALQCQKVNSVQNVRLHNRPLSSCYEGNEGSHISGL